MRAVSLFTNCGAGDLGFRKAGFIFDVIAEIESKRIAVAQLNHPEAHAVCGDVRETWPVIVDAYRRIARKQRLSLLSACPPCQGMSSVRPDRGSEEDPLAGARDTRNLLVVPIVNVARALLPRIIVVENVPAFFRRVVPHPRTNKPISAAKFLVDELSGDYVAFPIICDLADFGVPQTRKRAFITLVHRNEVALATIGTLGRSPYPRPSHGGARRQITVEEALVKARFPAIDSRVASLGLDRKRPLHFVPVLDRMRYKMIAAIPPKTGLSAWDNATCFDCGVTNQPSDVATCSECGSLLPRPTLKEPSGHVRLISGFRASSYRRMRADRPAATITTASAFLGSSFTIHPWENRVLSVAECAMLQAFPKSFRWGDALSAFGSSAIRTMIGEAVPPRFTERHGRVLASMVRKSPSRSMLSVLNLRCVKAVKLLNQQP